MVCVQETRKEWERKEDYEETETYRFFVNGVDLRLEFKEYVIIVEFTLE